MSQLWGSVPPWECGFPISLDSGVFAAWNSLLSPSQLGHPHPAAFLRLPQLLLCQDWGIAGVMMQELFPLQGRADTNPGVLLPVVPALPGATPACGDTQRLGQGNCIRACATLRAGGAPGSCPDLSFPVTHKHPEDLTASCPGSVQTSLRAWQGTTGVPGGALVALVVPFKLPPLPSVLQPGDLGLEGAEQPRAQACVRLCTASVCVCVLTAVCPCVSTRAFPAQPSPWQGLCRGQVTWAIKTLPRCPPLSWL